MNPTTTFTASEAFLIAQAQQGCRASIEELINRNYQRMLRVAQRVVRNDTEAEDVVQDVCIILIRKLGEFRGQSALSTWLTAITMNAAVNSLRKKKRHGLSFEQLTGEQPNEVQSVLAEQNQVPNPEEIYLDVETRGIISSGLNTLPEHYREPLQLRLAEDLSVEEISSRLGVPIGTVKVQLFRGRKAIKQHLADRLRPAA